MDWVEIDGEDMLKGNHLPPRLLETRLGDRQGLLMGARGMPAGRAGEFWEGGEEHEASRYVWEEQPLGDEAGQNSHWLATECCQRAPESAPRFGSEGEKMGSGPDTAGCLRGCGTEAFR